MTNRRTRRKKIDPEKRAQGVGIDGHTKGSDPNKHPHHPRSPKSGPRGTDVEKMCDDELRVISVGVNMHPLDRAADEMGL